MMYKCSNGRRLLIATKEGLDSALDSSGLVPCVVLLTAWRSEDGSIDSWGSLIRTLLDRGCSYFACVGTYSEDLHDAIDDFYYRYNEAQGVERSDLVTTYHHNESIDDVIAYFVHGTELRCRKNGCLVAVLDGAPEDQEIEDFIKKYECKPMEGADPA